MLKEISKKDDKKPPVNVTICVIDEGKDIKKSYSCSRELLVQHVGYLAQIFEASSLDINEVSIHCDVNIFNWLLQWIRKVDSSPEQLPLLDGGNVVPVLLSAEFLLMKGLVSACVGFLRENINKLLLPANVFQILSEETVSRLLNTFTNCEVEDICEENEAAKEHLYGKMITLLLVDGARPSLGHYSSLRSLFKCSACGQLVQEGRSVSLRVPCTLANMMLSPSMDVLNLHKREVSWKAGDLVDGLVKKQGLTSRAAYWRLWGQCHFLLCAACGWYFPVGQMGWCPHHPGEPQLTDRGWAHQCCQSPTFPGDPLRNMPGCSFQKHQPILETDDDNAVFKIYERLENLIAAPDGDQQSYMKWMFRNFLNKDAQVWWNVLKKLPAQRNYFEPNIWEIYPKKKFYSSELCDVEAN